MVDARCVGPGQSGIGRYTENLCQSAELVAGRGSCHLLATKEGAAFLKSSANAHFVRAGEEGGLPDLLRSLKIDVFHSPLFVLPPIRPCSYVFTLHDVIPLSHPQYTHAAFSNFFKRRVPPALRIASHVVAVSEYSRREAIRLLAIPERSITVVHEPASPRFSPEARGGESTGERYLLAVGALDRRKNLTAVLRALHLLQDKGRRPPVVATPRRAASSRATMASQCRACSTPAH